VLPAARQAAAGGRRSAGGHRRRGHARGRWPGCAPRAPTNPTGGSPLTVVIDDTSWTGQGPPGDLYAPGWAGEGGVGPAGPAAQAAAVVAPCRPARSGGVANGLRHDPPGAETGWSGPRVAPTRVAPRATSRRCRGPALAGRPGRCRRPLVVGRAGDPPTGVGDGGVAPATSRRTRTGPRAPRPHLRSRSRSRSVTRAWPPAEPGSGAASTGRSTPTRPSSSRSSSCKRAPGRRGPGPEPDGSVVERPVPPDADPPEAATEATEPEPEVSETPPRGAAGAGGALAGRRRTPAARCSRPRWRARAEAAPGESGLPGERHPWWMAPPAGADDDPGALSTVDLVTALVRGGARHQPGARPAPAPPAEPRRGSARPVRRPAGDRGSPHVAAPASRGTLADDQNQVLDSLRKVRGGGPRPPMTCSSPRVDHRAALRGRRGRRTRPPPPPPEGPLAADLAADEARRRFPRRGAPTPPAVMWRRRPTGAPPSTTLGRVAGRRAARRPAAPPAWRASPATRAGERGPPHRPLAPRRGAGRTALGVSGGSRPGGSIRSSIGPSTEVVFRSVRDHLPPGVHPGGVEPARAVPRPLSTPPGPGGTPRTARGLTMRPQCVPPQRHVRPPGVRPGRGRVLLIVGAVLLFLFITSVAADRRVLDRLPLVPVRWASPRCGAARSTPKVRAGRDLRGHPGS